MHFSTLLFTRSNATRLALAVAGMLALSGCANVLTPSKWFDKLTPYRVTVVQGNVVTKEQVAALKTGMSRAQVRDILGSPLITDVFHGERWDYVFTIRRNGVDAQRRSVVVLFEGDSLKSVEGADLPSEREFVASLGPKQLSGPSPVLELTPEQRAKLPVPPAQTTAVNDAPQGAVRTYPPLETTP